MDAVSRSDAELVAGDCHLANGAIAEDAGKVPLHPMQVLARAVRLRGAVAVRATRAPTAVRKVAVDDIPELRAYHKQRDELRAHVIALKARRRVHLGTIMTIAFENFDTIKWQISEMVWAERIVTEEGVAEEVAIYNGLVPDEHQLSATLFIELTDDDTMREWLPKLVGIHEAIEIRVPRL